METMAPIRSCSLVERCFCCRVVVRFKANENDQSSSGIRLSWTAVELPKLIEDHNGNIIGE